MNLETIFSELSDTPLGKMSLEDYAKARTIIVSGVNTTPKIHASVEVRGYEQNLLGHLYFVNDLTWTTTCNRGHWSSLLELLAALKSVGCYVTVVNTRYI